MTASETATRFRPYVEELLVNSYARENLRDAVENLRGAYDRVQKRRVKAARDERLRRQLETAVRSTVEAGKALRSARERPKRRWGRRVFLLAAFGAVGVGVALAVDERLRASVLGSDAAPARADGGTPTRATEGAATRDQLYREAQRLVIPGRSKMTKAELKTALREGAHG